ncbi:MAG TPA: LysM domain-containing protein [Acidimicrobiales bacterium]|nr:LysM domain-containing protein [Acidimicrobiales bacterium]
MAIAPLLDTESGDWSADLLGTSWPRPVLRPVSVPTPSASPARRAGRGVTERRARRAVVRRRRRAVVLVTVAAALTCGLALPLTSVGGSPLTPQPGPLASAAGEAVYVVRPGDTLWSIAARFDRGGNPRPMAEALARETGSAVVVPGERIRIP